MLRSLSCVCGRNCSNVASTAKHAWPLNVGRVGRAALACPDTPICLSSVFFIFFVLMPSVSKRCITAVASTSEVR